jgi:DNA mismatch repair protein MutS2
MLENQGASSVNSVIFGLEEQRQRQQEAAEEAAALLMRAELLHEELQQRWQQQQQIKIEQQGLARDQLVGSIREGQKEVRQLIKRLRRGDAGGEDARQAGQRLKVLEAAHRGQIAPPPAKGWLPQVGDRVRLLSLGKAAEVLAIGDGGNSLQLRCGVLRLTVPLDGIEGLHGEKPVAPPPAPAATPATVFKSSAASSSPRTSNNSVDVRGMRVHEAEAVVEEHLRRCRGTLWVVHGVGTGRLKRGLRSWLEGLNYVDKVCDANQDEGGAGCSVVWLR